MRILESALLPKHMTVDELTGDLVLPEANFDIVRAGELQAGGPEGEAGRGRGTEEADGAMGSHLSISMRDPPLTPLPVFLCIPVP